MSGSEQLIVDTDVRVELKMKDLTCYKCKEWAECKCAFDLYNTNNDCLMSK